jgi:hypothetical protein
LVLALHALILIPLGLALLVMPEIAIIVWPWKLTLLTGRAIGAWLLALGVAAMHSTWENDWARVQAATISYIVFGVFELIALARYAGSVAWNRYTAWAYVLFLVSVLIIGVYGWYRSSRESAASQGTIT